MIASRLSRYVCTSTIALLATGCGTGSAGAPPLVQPGGAQQSAYRHGWISPAAKSMKLLYVSDYTSSIILIYPQGSSAGQPIGEIVDGVSTPAGIATDAQGNLYVANRGANTVTEYAPGGTSPTVTLSTGISSPSDVAVDGSGTLYVAETPLGTIQEYKKGDTSPDFTLTAMARPNGMGIDKHNDIFVAWNTPGGSPAGNVDRCKALSKACKTLGLTTELASDAQVDLQGNILVGDVFAEVINIYPPGSTTPSRVIETTEEDPAQFELDTKDKTLYVADPANFAIRLYFYSTGHQYGSFTFGISDELVGLALAPGQQPGK
jgi:hypothetical protein